MREPEVTRGPRPSARPRRADGDAVLSRGASAAHDRILALQAAAGNTATTAFLQASPDARSEGGPVSEEAWEGTIKGHLGDNISLRHTLNNFSDQDRKYLLRIRSTGHAMVSLETQYNYKNGGLQRAWIALYAQRGQTQEVTNGLPANSSLHLRFFGERDATQPDQSYFEGTVQVRRQK